jgi:hypothetical protein
MDIVQKHLSIAKSQSYQSMIICEVFKLKDGKTLSIQASTMHNCSPRKNLKDRSQYTHVEVYTGNAPSIRDYLIRYYDGYGVATNVPTGKLAKAIAKYEELI